MRRSRKGQKKGSGLESWLVQHAQMNRVWLRHNTPPMQVLRRDQRDRRIVTCRLEGKGWLDFTATLDGGVSADFDAKDVIWDGTARRWKLGARLRGHQGETLARLDSLGHIAFVYLRRRRPLSCQDYVVPAPALEGSPASILWDDLEAYVIPHGSSWLEAVDLWWAGYRELGWDRAQDDRMVG